MHGIIITNGTCRKSLNKTPMFDDEIVPVEVPELAPEIEDVPDAPAEEEVDWKAEAEKAKQIADNYKTRAEKAEKKVKEAPVAPATEQPMNLADATALLKADVHEDDIERVEKFARDEKTSVKDALKSDELKAILAVRTEKRSTAQAANVSNVRRGPSKVTDDVLLSKASKGDIPDGDDDIARLVAAKAKQK